MSEAALPFSGLVRDKMRERGLGLRELCRAADLDPSFLSKVLAGKRSPPWEEAALRRLAAALGADPTLLIVSAGRIPSEWSGLWTNSALFHSVHNLAAGVKTPATERSREGVRMTPKASPEGRQHVRAPARTPTHTSHLEEELL